MKENATTIWSTKELHEFDDNGNIVAETVQFAVYGVVYPNNGFEDYRAMESLLCMDENCVYRLFAPYYAKDLKYISEKIRMICDTMGYTVITKETGTTVKPIGVVKLTEFGILPIGCWFSGDRGFYLGKAIVQCAVAHGWDYKNFDWDPKDTDCMEMWDDAEEFLVDKYPMPEGFEMGYHPDYGDFGIWVCEVTE